MKAKQINSIIFFKQNHRKEKMREWWVIFYHNILALRSPVQTNRLDLITKAATAKNFSCKSKEKWKFPSIHSPSRSSKPVVSPYSQTSSKRNNFKSTVYSREFSKTKFRSLDKAETSYFMMRDTQASASKFKKLKLKYEDIIKENA